MLRGINMKTTIQIIITSLARNALSVSSLNKSLDTALTVLNHCFDMDTLKNVCNLLNNMERELNTCVQSVNDTALLIEKSDVSEKAETKNQEHLNATKLFKNRLVRAVEMAHVLDDIIKEVA